MTKLQALAVTALLGAGLVGWLRSRESNASPAHATPPASRPEAALPELRVPRASEAIRLDGELDEPDWKRAARTGTFVDAAGGEASPFSDARMVWQGGNLLFGLYAADQDIHSAEVAHDGPVWKKDSFHVTLTAGGKDYEIDVGPTGTVADGVRARGGATDYSWESGAKLACDSDGTVDHPGDMDEEWVVEMAVPLRSLGVEAKPGERIEVHLRRCDGDLDSPGRRCSNARPFVAVLEPM